MDDKIKIYVPNDIKRILEKDAENFEFLKPSGKTNFNAFITNLIINYTDIYQTYQDNIYNYICKQLQAEDCLQKPTNHNIVLELCSYIQEISSPFSDMKCKQVISIKPTKESINIINFIEENNLHGKTLSEYFRGLFTSYINLPPYEREKIIFKKEYDSLSNAIKYNRQVYLTIRAVKNSKIHVTTSPYAICSSKEELHLYLLSEGVNDHKAYPTRLSRILNVKELYRESTISNENLIIFEKMKKYGPEFRYFEGETNVIVKLSEAGKLKFDSIRIHRPIPDQIIDNLYYFSCSHEQLFRYFTRFGEDALIVYPCELCQKFSSFYQKALNNISLYPEN